MSNPFGNSGAAPPAIPARSNKTGDDDSPGDAPVRTLMTKEACLVYKIPPQVIVEHRY